jgi:hypothetical protein
MSDNTAGGEIVSTDTTAIPPIEGGCLCGAVRYRYRGENRLGYKCHCRMCQLAFGNIFATFLNAKKHEVEWLREIPCAYRSSAFATRSFCNRCGTPLAFAFDDSEFLDLSVGSLDAPGGIKPNGHFAVETRFAEWHVPDGLEEMRAADYDALNKRWKDYYGDAEPGLETVRAGTTQAFVP